MTVRGSTALRATFAYLAIFSAAVFWGGNAIASKILYRPDAHFDGPDLFVARAVWSLPLFLLMALLARPKQAPSRGDWWLLIGTGVAFGPGCCGFLALAAQYTSGAHVVLLMSLTPVMTAVIGGFALRERVDALRIVALLIGMAGAVLLTVTRSASGSHVLGDAFEVVQAFSYAVMLILTRALGRRYSAVFVTGTYGAIGMSMLALTGLALGRVGPAIALTLVPNPGVLWWFFGEIVIGLSIYGQFAQAFALRYLPAGTTAIVGSYGTLIVGMIGAIALLGESISSSGYFAAALLAVALALSIIPSLSRDRSNGADCGCPSTSSG